MNVTTRAYGSDKVPQCLLYKSTFFASADKAGRFRTAILISAYRYDKMYLIKQKIISLLQLEHFQDVRDYRFQLRHYPTLLS